VGRASNTGTPDSLPTRRRRQDVSRSVIASHHFEEHVASRQIAPEKH